MGHGESGTEAAVKMEKSDGMDRSGQVFTLDMFFALTLTALVVSYSGLALEQARGQAEGYALGYSLERTANDAADVLVKTAGRPSNWWENTGTLETLGLTEENEGIPIQNTLDVRRFGQFRRLTNRDNWVAPINANAVEAIKRLFGGSENFEIRILDDNGNELWHAFPGWVTGEVGENSGAENSLDVAVVRRLVAMRYGTTIKADSGRVVGEQAPWEKDENLEFEIYPEELDAFDFYIVVMGAGINPRAKIWVNKVAEPPYQNPDYFFPTDPKILLETFPKQHGGVENDSGVDNQLHVGTNFLGLWIKANPNKDEWVRIYVVTVPSCSDWTIAPLMLETLPATLELKLWR